MADPLQGNATPRLTAFLDFRQAADFLAQKEPDINVRGVYYEIFVQSWNLYQYFTEAKKSFSTWSFIQDRLEQLNSLLAPLVYCNSLADDQSKYPNLQRLHYLLTTEFDNDDAKLAALQNCAAFGNKDKQSALLAVLTSSHMTITQSETYADCLESDFEPPRKLRQKPPDDVRSAADSLFRVLEAKGGCTCEPVHKCIVQLSLATHRMQTKSCNFDLYFGLEHIWQEAQVQTSPSAMSGIATLPTSIRAAAPLAHRSMRIQHKKPVDRLCEDIIQVTERFPDYRLKLRMEEDCLWRLTAEESSFLIDKSKPPVSLTQLLDQESDSLTEKTKRILGVLLAYAVLHLHETSWLPPDWGSHNVMFFRSYDGVPLRPYIRNYATHDEISEKKEFDPYDPLNPSCPCLVGLAEILMELHKATPFHTLSEYYNGRPSDQSDLAARFVFAKKMFKHFKHEFTDQTRMAIDACLDPRIGINEVDESLEDDILQNVIYERVVRRLEDELEQGFRDVLVDQLDSMIQNLDFRNGGQPISENRSYAAATLAVTSRPKRQLDGDQTGRRVRFRDSTNDRMEMRACNVDPSTSQPGESRNESRVSTKNSDGRVREVLGQNATPIEIAPNFVAPLMPYRSSSERPDTLRVMNVPDSMSKVDLCAKLEKDFAWKCKVHSLFKAFRDSRWKQYATVTFPEMPNSELDRVVCESQSKELENAFEYDKKFLGLTPLYDGGDTAVLDIIALEGLGTNPFGTFRAPRGDKMWLRDFLPENFPSCRILLYGYDSEVVESKSDQKVPEIAGTCKNIVTNFRETTKTDGRPIIWLGQSMGGLIVQEVLVLAHQHRSQRTSGNLLDRTIGFLGYGVPTNGLRNESLLNAVKNQPNFELIRSICLEDGRPSCYLQSLANRFALCNGKLKVHNFYETNPSPDNWNLEATAERRVDDQGVIGHDNTYWVARNHRDLVKVPSRSDFVYTITVQIISLIIDKRPADGY